MIVAIDFDDTIAKSNFPAIGDEIPGATETIRDFQRNGIKCILWTCRNNGALEDAVTWLKEREVVFDAVNDQVPTDFSRKFGWTRKIFAHCYVDDRGLDTIFNTGINWDDVKYKVYELKRAVDKMENE